MHRQRIVTSACRPLWDPTSQGSSPHRQIQIRDGSILPFLDPSLIFPFHILPSPVHPTGFSFCFFPGFLAIFILLSSNNSIPEFPSVSFQTSLPFLYCCHRINIVVIPDFPSVSSLASLPFLYCCHRTTIWIKFSLQIESSCTHLAYLIAGHYKCTDYKPDC